MDEREEAVGAVDVVAVECGIGVVVVGLAGDVDLVHALEGVDHVRRRRIELTEEIVLHLRRGRHLAARYHRRCHPVHIEQPPVRF